MKKRDWLTDPLWRADSLGLPIPDDEFAVSASLPTWADVIGYEEADPAVVDKMRLGYPRFVLHPAVKRLFAEAERKFGGRATVWPGEASAERAAAFVRKRGGVCRVVPMARLGLCALVGTESSRKDAVYYWRISGDIVSSRLAAEYFAPAEPAGSTGARAKIQATLAQWSGQRAECVRLFPSGMAAIFFAQQAMQIIRPGSRCTQVEFPYVDALRVQREFSGGSLFVSSDEVGKITAETAGGGVFAEIPSNPLLRCPDFGALRQRCDEAESPLFLDDTVASVLNADAFRFADMVTTSLTKWTCGAGNVLAGALILNASSPWFSELNRALDSLGAPVLPEAEAAALLPHLDSFPQRMRRINETTEEVVAFLRTRPEARSLWHPLTQTRPHYEQVKRDGGGYGGLLSFAFNGGETVAARFYDAWRIAKGPSLGTNFTLACPFTLLAHYDELDWAAAQGVPRDLIRLSVGLEEPGDLIRRWIKACA